MGMLPIFDEATQTGQNNRRAPVALFVIAVLLSCVVCAGVSPAMAGEETAKEIVLKWIGTMYGKKNVEHDALSTGRVVDAVEKYAHPDILIQLQTGWHSPVSGTREVRGKENVKKHYEAVKSLWQQKAEWFKVRIDEMIAEGDTVAVRRVRTYKDRKLKEVVTRTVTVFYKVKEGRSARFVCWSPALPVKRRSSPGGASLQESQT